MYVCAHIVNNVHPDGNSEHKPVFVNNLLQALNDSFGDKTADLNTACDANVL